MGQRCGGQQTSSVLATGQERSGEGPWCWLIVAIVALGAVLIATGAILALFPSGEHLNAAGRNYADYFITRNLALALALLLTLALRARPLLTVLMVLTALIQGLDAATAMVTGRFGLVPVDAAFAVTFVAVAARVSRHGIWRARSWRALAGESTAAGARLSYEGTEPAASL